MGTPAVVPKALPENKFPTSGSIGPQFVKRIMPWFEQYYFAKKVYPGAAEIIQRFGFTLEQVNQLNSHKFWLRALDNRGITRPGREPHELSERQIAAITIITNFHDVRNPVAKLASIGVSEEELNGWYQNVFFKAELNARADEILDHVAPDATAALAQAIKRGNFQAIKFYYEITGKAQSPEAVNLKQAMQVLIEAVQKHVKDPAVLEAIASEVQSIRQVQGF